MTTDNPPSFRDRSRQHVATMLATYGDQLAGVLRMIDADCAVMDADRECFTSEEGQHYAKLEGWLRQATLHAYMLADAIGGIDTRDGILSVSKPHQEPDVPQRPGSEPPEGM